LLLALKQSVLLLYLTSISHESLPAVAETTTLLTHIVIICSQVFGNVLAFFDLHTV